MLELKQQKWNGCKSSGNEKLLALAEYSSGEKILSKSQKDEQLEVWFKEIAQKIMELAYEDATLAGRKIQMLITALEEVEEFHQISNSLHVKQYLNDTRDLLRKMIRYVNIKEDVLVSLSVISDISYAWDIRTQGSSNSDASFRKEERILIMREGSFLILTCIAST